MALRMRVLGWSALVAGSVLGGARGQTILYRIPGTEAGGGARTTLVNPFEFDTQVDGMVVGFPLADGGGLTDCGRVDVYDGRTAVLQYSLWGSRANQHFGVQLAAGLWNNSPYAEDLWLAVGSDDAGGRGQVDLYGVPTGTLLLSIPGPAPAGGFGGGGIVSMDYDGDGSPDLVGGAPTEDSAVAKQAGAVHVFSLATGAEIATQQGGSDGALYGMYVAMGDINGDGGDDLFVGATGEGGMGAVYAYDGASHAELWTASGAAGDEFGSVIAFINHDADNDGLPDVAVGAPASGDPAASGAVYFLSGATGAQIATLDLGEAGDRLGTFIKIKGLPGDCELFAGAPGADAGGTDRGRVSWFDVTDPANPVLLGALDGESDGDGLGASLDFFKCPPCPPYPPLDGQGLLVASPGSDLGASDGGSVAIATWCDALASATNYGTGWPGTLSIPGILLSPPPVLGSAVTLTIDNSAPFFTRGLLLLGFAKASIPTNSGGVILVAPPWIRLLVPLPVGGVALPGTIPLDTNLAGLELDLQCLEFDPGAPGGLSFTPGLELILGG